MILRDYQDAAVCSIFEYFASGKTGNPIVALPTGTGKSIVLGEFIKRALQTYPGTRIMKLTHVKELVSQNLKKLLQLWPEAPAGVYSAGLGRKDQGCPITFGGVASVAKASPSIFGRIDLLLIDECHLVSQKETTMYRVIIDVLKTANPCLKVIGFTATHYRLGYGMLTEEGGIFTDLCFNMTQLSSFNWFLDQGYLARLIPRTTVAEFDLSGVHIHGGEYKQDELQSVVDKSEITYAACQELLQWGQNRHHWLIFASGIEHAEHIADCLEYMGIASTFVHSKMSVRMRDDRIFDFIVGKYRAMINNGILTTGFDFPGIDLIGMLRATLSPGLWVQMLGRGTRPVYANGFDLTTVEGRHEAIKNGPKQNCLVLDFAGNTRRLGPINDPVLPRKKGKGKGEAPIKICEACGTYNHASVRFCESCGTEFIRYVKISEHAGTDELIATEEIKTEIFKVDRVTYAEHRKQDRPSSIQVSYYCGLRMFREWVCFEHKGFPARKAREWWRARAMSDPPVSTASALEWLDTLKEPTHIRVWIKPKYDEILAHDFSGTCFDGATK